MKKLLMGLALGFIFWLDWSLPASACNLVLEPSSFAVKSGETVSFRLERYKTHNVCVTPLEDTKIIVTGGVLADPGKWVTGIPDTLNFKVKFSAAGNASVRVERYCTKVGLMTVEAKGTVSLTATSPAVTVPVTTDTSSAPNFPEYNTPVPIETVTSPANEKNEPFVRGYPEEAPPQSSALSRFVSAITFDSLSLKLWYLFFIVGMGLFLFKLTSFRRPFLLAGVVVLGFYLGACPEPVGAPFILLMGNSSMFKIALIMLLIPVTVSLIWGRAFCGWICPLGAIQETIYSDKAGLNIPAPADRYLKLLKYIIVTIFIYLLWSTGTNYWAEYEPFKVLFNFEGTTSAMVILAITALLGVVIERPFCRYICPLGAILTLTSLVAPYKIRPAADVCKGCKACSKKVCPMNAIHMREDQAKLPMIDNQECIKCLRCEDQCRFKAIFAGFAIRSGHGKGKNMIDDLNPEKGK